MIVRILGQGQWVMEPEQLLALNEIDEAVERAVADGDEATLRAALEQLITGVKTYGTEVPDDVLAESDLILPDSDATLDVVRGLLDSQSEYYGLIPDEETFASEADVVTADGVEPGPETAS